VLQGRSLESALLSLVNDFQRSTQITPKWLFHVQETLPDALNTATYRIIQESLTNICKYAQATAVAIQIELLTEDEKNLQVSIQDNGQGFDLNQTKTGFGLQGMQERTNALSGHFQINTAPQQGCKIVARFPIYSLSRL
jgi:signal transduction histidine kinase